MSKLEETAGYDFIISSHGNACDDVCTKGSVCYFMYNNECLADYWWQCREGGMMYKLKPKVESDIE